MSIIRCALLVIGLALALVAPTARAEESLPTELVSSRTRAALAASGDEEALRKALGSTADVWVLCHQLCLLGSFDVALELAAVADPIRAAGLAKQIEVHRALGPQHDELRTVWAKLPALQKARKAEPLIEFLDALPESKSPISRVRLFGSRGLAHRLARNARADAEVQEQGAAAAAALGWHRRASQHLRAAAFAWERAGDATRSLASFRGAVKLADDAGDAEGAAAFLNDSTVVLGRLGHADTLLEVSLEVVRRYEALQDLRSVGWNQARVASVYRRRGRLSEAMVWIEKAVVNAEKSGCPHCRGNAFNERGVVERMLTRYAEAVESHEEAYRLNRAEGKQHGMAVSKQRQGNALLRMGDFRRALLAFEAAREHGRAAMKRRRESRLIIESSRHGEAQVRQQLGQTDKALQLYEVNLEAYEKRRDFPGIAKTLNNIGSLLASSHEAARAIPYLERSLALKRELKGPTSRALSLLANALDLSGRSAEALPMFQEARAEAERGQDPFAVALARVGTCDALKNVGRLDEAATLARETLELTKDLDGPSIRASLWRSLSDIQRRRGQLPEAITAAKNAVRAGSRLVEGLGAEQVASARDRLHLIFTTGLEAAVAAASPADAVYFLETGRAGALLESLKARDALEAILLPAPLQSLLKTAREREIDAAATFNAVRANGTRGAIRQARRSLQAAQTHLQEVVERVQGEAKALAQITYPRPDSLEMLQQSLVPGEALLLYGASLSDTVCVVVHRDAARIASLGPHGAIHDLIERLRDTAPPYVDEALAKETRAALIDPLKLGKTRRVLISPFREIGTVPFSLLLPQHEIAFVGSGTTYRLLREQVSNHDEEVDHGTVLGVGDPVYSAASRLPSLPGSREEVAAVATEVLLAEKATEPAFREALAKRDLWCAIHFACHGLLDVDRPMFSALALTPTEGDDGLLTALDVFQLRVPAELVVLSACETAGGKIYAAEGIVGLTRAFTHAGAPRVLSSLWKVDDAATRALMVEFYKLWNPTGGGLSPAAALQQAQEYVRSQEQWAHPRFWAAWVLWGLPR